MTVAVSGRFLVTDDFSELDALNLQMKRLHVGALRITTEGVIRLAEEILDSLESTDRAIDVELLTVHATSLRSYAEDLLRNIEQLREAQRHLGSSEER